MTPPCYTFSAGELPERIQFDVHGRQRKMLPAKDVKDAQDKTAAPSGQVVHTERSGSSNARHRDIDLARDCTLLSSMLQYSCAVVHPEMRDSPVRCWPVQRLFRR